MTAAVPNNETLRVFADGFLWSEHSAEVICSFEASDLSVLQLSTFNPGAAL